MALGPNNELVPHSQGLCSAFPQQDAHRVSLPPTHSPVFKELQKTFPKEHHPPVWLT